MSGADSSGVIAPPPVLYLGTLLLGSVVHVAAPLSLLSTTLAHWVAGVLLMAISAAFARWAFVTLRRAGTSANPYQPSVALTTTGPFRFSRNPIYLAMTGLYLGTSLLVNSVWPLLLFAPLMLVMHHGVILKEERYLSATFGEAYAAYKSGVRRWL